MAKSQRGKPRLTIRVEDDIIKKIEQIATDKEVTVSYIVRQLIDSYIKKEDNPKIEDKHYNIIYPKLDKAKK